MSGKHLHDELRRPPKAAAVDGEDGRKSINNMPLWVRAFFFLMVLSQRSNDRFD